MTRTDGRRSPGRCSEVRGTAAFQRARSSARIGLPARSKHEPVLLNGGIRCGDGEHGPAICC